MAVPLFPGTICRIQYDNWKTTPLPICFVIYSGVNGDKAHVLYLNAIGVSTLHMVKFLSTIKTIAQTKQNVHPRILYQIFKRYNYNFIKFSYRTLFKSKISASAIISYGIADKDKIGELYRSRQNIGLYNQAMKTLVANIVGFYMRDKKVGLDFYQPAIADAKKIGTPQKLADIRDINVKKKDSVKTTVPTKTSSAKKPGSFVKDVRTAPATGKGQVTTKIPRTVTAPPPKSRGKNDVRNKAMGIDSPKVTKSTITVQSKNQQKMNANKSPAKSPVNPVPKQNKGSFVDLDGY